MRWPPSATAPVVLVSRAVEVGRARISLRPARILQLALLLLVVGNLGRIPVFSTGSRDAVVLANDIFVLFVLVAGGLAMAHARAIRLDAVALAGLVFAAIGGASTLVSVSTYGLSAFETMVSLAYLARWLFYFAIYIVATNVLTVDDVTPVWSALEKMILLFAAFGVLQSATMPNFAQMVYPDSRLYTDWDPQYRRLVSTVLDPNFAGGMILSVLLVHVAQLSGGLKVAAWKPLLLILALVLTASRSSLLAFVVGGAVVVATRGLGRRMLKFMALAAVALAIAGPTLLYYAKLYNKLGVSDASAMARLVMWARAATMIADHPVLGIGFNTWGFVQERYGFMRFGGAAYGTEGGLLFVTAMTGVVGLTVFLAMYGLVLARARQTWRSASAPPEHRALAVGVAAFSVCLLVHSMFSNSLFLPFVIEPLFVLWALVRVASSAVSRDRSTG